MVAPFSYAIGVLVQGSRIALKKLPDHTAMPSTSTPKPQPPTPRAPTSNLLARTWNLRIWRSVMCQESIMVQIVGEEEPVVQEKGVMARHQ